MTPLVLLGLLTFFFVIALSFALWSALTLGDAARRRHAAAQRPTGKPAVDRGSRAEQQPSPFEATQPRPNPALRSSQAQPAQQQPAQQQPAEQPKLKARPATPRQPQAEVKSAPSNEEEHVARVVVTPRKANDDAFERFLESEKRRD